MHVLPCSTYLCSPLQEKPMHVCHKVLDWLEGELTSMPWSSWMRKSRGVWGTWPVSHEGPHTLFRVIQSELGPLI